MIACSLLHIDKLTPQGRERVPVARWQVADFHPRGILSVSTVREGRELTVSKKRWSLIIKKKLEPEKAERLLEEPDRKYFKK
jgi:hypothetical protein